MGAGETVESPSQLQEFLPRRGKEKQYPMAARSHGRAIHRGSSVTELIRCNQHKKNGERDREAHTPPEHTES